MAFSNTYTATTDPAVGSAVSNREDLTDVLTILAPEETPILSSANKQKATATFVEWTVDSLASPDNTPIREGADVGDTIGNDTDAGFKDKFAGRARLGNYIQKFRRAYQVSDLQEAVDSVGPAKVAQAEAKAIRELKRDIEFTLSSSQDRSVEDGLNTGYALRGLGKWIDSTNTASGGSSDVPDTFKTPEGSIVDVSGSETTFAETSLNSMITSVFKVTGSSNNLMLIADTALRNDISDFARISQNVSPNQTVRSVNYNGDSGTIKLSVDLYQSDHGVVSVVNANPDCAPAQDASGAVSGMQGYLVNPEYYGVHELIPMGSTRLPNQGGGERGYVDCALTLGVYHPGAHGKVISTS
jgi:hypothetical protein|tara:strand:+ start:4249 stop:5316 length:1068 start_codon:yes stop_codon:yes gene_type:complete